MSGAFRLTEGRIEVEIGDRWEEVWPKMPTIDRKAARAPGSLDAAWAEAEAALPEGWHLWLRFDSGRRRCRIEAIGPTGSTRQMTRDTPAAALRALAERLREVGR